MPLTIVAKITANAGHEAKVRAALEALIAPTRAEEGCLQYDLHVDNDAPGVFLFFENWTSRDTWQAHMQSPHVKANGPATEGAVQSVELHEMTKVE